ncbi:ImmA/IrrE family metallo-endopeptidase [uncultured Bacteroides sp.]|jgi:hypothetical protein|uniref:ImmA/IrrE family metallo-endopeptidase n=1 Tax=uncultured Bacteroides sp. TaxID=162156 RepID=UPI00280A633B|nr:ImmA/IrrE family metallo-endopeptidase [uncultured Bacteroides sp.]
MSKISAKQKGDILEEWVYNMIKKQVDENSFLANKSLCKVFRQKKYYSKDRQDYIAVDVSVEVTYPNANKYSLLYIFECKNYKGKVSIDNIEEFMMKLSQIAGYNVKGIMVTTSSYSQKGINLASSKGISLARVIAGKIAYDVYRVSSTCQKYSTVDLLCSDKPRLPLCIYDSNMFYSIRDFFSHLGIIEQSSSKSRLVIPYMENDTIKEKGEAVLQKYVPDVFHLIQATSLEDICKQVAKEKFLNFVYDEDLGYEAESGCEILGKIQFTPDIIFISSRLSKDIHRFRFTLAHELGHYFLHTKYLSDYKAENIDTILNLNAEISNSIIKRMELQANIFASNLLMPDIAFYALVKQRYLYDKIKGGILILDDQSCNIKTFHRVTSEISSFFNVSKESAKYKLQELGLLINKSSIHKIKDFF